MTETDFKIPADYPGHKYYFNIFLLDICIYNVRRNLITFSSFQTSEVKNILSVPHIVYDIERVAKDISGDGVAQFMEYYAERFEAAGYLLLPHKDDIGVPVLFEIPSEP